MTTTPLQPFGHAPTRPHRWLGGAAGAALLVTLAAVLPAAASADSRLVARTTQQGIELKLNLPAGRWQGDQRVSGFVQVTNTNDRNAWFLDIGCRDVGVAARVPTDPGQGREWSGDRAAFKRLALSARAEIGPIVGRFTVEGRGDCAEPAPQSLPAGASRTYDVSWRVRHVGLGVSFLDVSAAYQFEGFRKSDAQWQDRLPSPITASVHVPIKHKAATILSSVKAIDLGLAKARVRRDIAASDRSGWSDVQMVLSYGADGRWQWRVMLFGSADPGEPDNRSFVVVGFVVNARTGTVTTD